MIHPQIGKIPHWNENVDKKRDRTLLQLDNLMNIKTIDAFNYQDMENEIVEMALNEDDKSVDKTFFNRDIYKGYKKRKEIIYKQIEEIDKQMREVDTVFINIDVKIKGLEQKIKPVRFKKDGEIHSSDIGKQRDNEEIVKEKTKLMNTKTKLIQDKKTNKEKKDKLLKDEDYILTKQMNYRNERIRDKTLKKITEKGPLDALKDVIKVGNAGQLFIGPAFKDYETDLFSTENIDKVFNEKLDDFKKNFARPIK
jgi:hypothetical protein